MTTDAVTRDAATRDAASHRPTTQLWRGLSLVGCCVLTASAAQAEEYRRITLNDGRVIVAAISETTADGLNLSLPQGHTTVRFDQVQSLEEVDESVYNAQPVWTIVVLPPSAADAELAPTLDEQLNTALSDIPGIIVTAPDRMSRLSSGQRRAFARCATDAACAQGFLNRSGATAAISARLEGRQGDRSLVVVANFSEAPLARREVTVDWWDDKAAMSGPLRQTVEASLHLTQRPVERILPHSQEVASGAEIDPSAPPQATTKPKPARATPDSAKLARLVWVPLPGMPSIARSDWGGFGESMAFAGAGTAAMVSVAGQASFSAPQLIATSAASFYLLNVMINKAIGLHGLDDTVLDATVSVLPLPGGGVTLGVTAPLGNRRARRP